MLLSDQLAARRFDGYFVQLRKLHLTLRDDPVALPTAVDRRQLNSIHLNLGCMTSLCDEPIAAVLQGSK